ncbi:hypothetical protein [Micavibrio aeruginosavorus]|uniref:hypothetical protein n=1 Tax=Micavibrio aeruginosavorus TaxID=349221 RepID=UPI003F4AE60B
MTHEILPSGILVATDGMHEPVKALGQQNYIHLTGGIYLPVPMHELSLPQLQDVNRLRDDGFKSGLEQKNDTLKIMVANAVQDFSEDRALTIVDVGSGQTTIAPYFSKISRYVSIDIDPHVVATLNAQGVESHAAENIREIGLNNDGINVLIALYMLQFRIDENLFADLASIMRGHDVMFANLYRIDNDRKEWLRERIVAAGLTIGPEIADTKISPGRQVFWTVAKDQGAADRLAAMFGAKLN